MVTVVISGRPVSGFVEVTVWVVLPAKRSEIRMSGSWISPRNLKEVKIVEDGKIVLGDQSEAQNRDA